MGVLDTGTGLDKQRRDPMPLIIGAIVVLLGAGAAFYFYQRAQLASNAEAVLTDEARAYLPQLDLSEVEMAASDTFLEQRLVEINGKITNLGERAVSLVQINCVFRDVNGIEIAREPRVVIGPKNGPLDPQEQKTFRLPFDNLPAEWNQVMPSLFIAQIDFE